ncbi:MAG: ABC-type sugar transport system periplasmic component-like protein [Solirubrobacterales bacterium]|nr:ABC-type sugar transport system periplasmic component-like protein [Solirubrobacterales bacterium]
MKLHIASARVFAAAVLCMIGLALVIAGCGGGSSSSSTSSGGSTESSEGSSGGAAGEGSSSSESAFPKAAEANAEFEERPTTIGIETPVGKPIPKGKTIDFIQCGVPACKTEGELFESAASALGWTVNSINAGTTPEEIKAAYDQAIKDEPDAVLGSGYPRSLFNPELEELKAKNIPVIEFFVEEEAGNGITAVLGGIPTSETQGKMMADYILAHSTNESMEIGVVNAQGFETVTGTAASVEKVFSEECSGCKVKKLEAPLTAIGKDLPQRIASFLTANPGIEWTTVGYDDMVTGLPTALKGAGVENAKLTTVNISTSIAPYMANGEYLQSTVGSSFPEVYWRGIDLLARLFAGVEYKEDENDSTLPYWTVTKETLPTTEEEFPVVENYEEQFKQLWGVE